MAQMPALISFLPNTTILSADTNSNNISIRTVYNTHDIATTGVHGVGAGALVGTTLSQTLTNKTLTAVILGGGAVMSSGNLVLNSGANLQIYSDVATTLKFNVDGPTGSFGIPAGQKFYLDGTLLSGTNYIVNNAANEIDIVTNGTDALALKAASVDVGTGRNFSIRVAKDLILDAGTNLAKITAASPNQIVFTTGGTAAFDANNTRVSIGSTRDFWVDPGKKINLNGGGTSYIYFETFTSDVQLWTGGVNSFSANATRFSLGSAQDLWIDQGKKVYFDAGVNDFITGTVNNQLNFFVSGTERLKITASEITSSHDFIANATNTRILGSAAIGWKKIFIDAGYNFAGPSSGADIVISNAGVGEVCGIKFDVSGPVIAAFRVTAAMMTTAAQGAYSGQKLPISVNGTIKYIHVFDP